MHRGHGNAEDVNKRAQIMEGKMDAEVYRMLMRVGRIQIIYAPKRARQAQKRFNEKRLRQCEQQALRILDSFGRACGGMGDMMR